MYLANLSTWRDTQFYQALVTLDHPVSIITYFDGNKVLSFTQRNAVMKV